MLIQEINNENFYKHNNKWHLILLKFSHGQEICNTIIIIYIMRSNYYCMLIVSAPWSDFLQLLKQPWNYIWNCFQKEKLVLLSDSRQSLHSRVSAAWIQAINWCLESGCSSCIWNLANWCSCHFSLGILSAYCISLLSLQNWIYSWAVSWLITFYRKSQEYALGILFFIILKKNM